MWEEKIIMGIFKERSQFNKGDKFEKLTVQRFGYIKKGEAMWECLCECGNIAYVSSCLLNNNTTKSCGCSQNPSGKKSHRWKGFEGISLEFWNVSKRNAIKRNLPFNITIEYAWELFIKQNKKCALSGMDLFFNSTTKKFDGNASLDRIDSEIGYIEGNVQWVHKNINKMKNNYAQESFLNLIKKIYEYNYK